MNQIPCFNVRSWELRQWDKQPFTGKISSIPAQWILACRVSRSITVFNLSLLSDYQHISDLRSQILDLHTTTPTLICTAGYEVRRRWPLITLLDYYEPLGHIYDIWYDGYRISSFKCLTSYKNITERHTYYLGTEVVMYVKELEPCQFIELAGCNYN